MSAFRAARAAAALAALLSGTACGPPPQGAATSAAPSRAASDAAPRDELVVIPSGESVRAIAVSRRFVYAVTGGAVAVYDRLRQTWLPPFTRDLGFEPSVVRAIAVDPDDDSAWLFSSAGAWTLQPLTGFVMRAPPGAAPARLQRGSLDAVFREFPSVEAFARVLARDASSLLPWPVIAGARAPDRAEVWLGTQGGGLYRVDPLFNRAEPMPFGLATSGAGAVTRDADRIWIAPAGRAGDGRLALTALSRELQETRWIADPSRRAMGASRATALAIASGEAWLGTTGGLYHVALSRTGAPVFSRVSALPSDEVLSLLPYRGALWVGTARGAVVLPTDAPRRDRVTPPTSREQGAAEASASDGISAPVAVRALAATGDTLWAGTDDGLLVRAPGVAQFVIAGPGAFGLRLRQPVRALASSDSVMLVALTDAVLVFNRRSGAWSEPWRGAPWAAVGGVEALEADGRTIWAGGPLGVVAIDRATGGSRTLRAGSDLPDAVTGLLLDGPWAWVATLGGVVRVRRASDGLIP